MNDKFKIPIIGQEAICPDGIGRVMEFNYESKNKWIKVSTYFNDRQCCWDFENVELISQNRSELEKFRKALQKICYIAENSSPTKMNFALIHAIAEIALEYTEL